MIDSAHTLLHHLEDSSEDLTELVYCPFTSQIVDSAHPKSTIIDNDDSVTYLIHMLLATTVYNSFINIVAIGGD